MEHCYGGVVWFRLQETMLVAEGGVCQSTCITFFLQLKANVVGTEYLLRGKGGDINSHKGFNAQLLAVNYKPTINHIKTGPRTMTAVVPVPESQVGQLGLRPLLSTVQQLKLWLPSAMARHTATAY